MSRPAPPKTLLGRAATDLPVREFRVDHHVVVVALLRHPDAVEQDLSIRGGLQGAKRHVRLEPSRSVEPSRRSLGCEQLVGGDGLDGTSTVIGRHSRPFRRPARHNIERRSRKTDKTYVLGHRHRFGHDEARAGDRLAELRDLLLGERARQVLQVDVLGRHGPRGRAGLRRNMRE